MRRLVLAATLALVGCGRSDGVPDEQLGGLVIAPRPKVDPIDVARAARDPAELGRALQLPYHRVVTALGPHTFSLSTANLVEEAGKKASELTDHATIELGEGDVFHAVYTNSADYGREVTFAGGTLYLRSRYQRWHARAPEAPEEPGQIRDSFFEAIAATWELLAPGAELTDLGPVQVAGRAGKKIQVKLAPSPRRPPAEALIQRKWREQRTIDAVTGEVVLDAEHGVPLAAKLAGTIGFSRDGRRFSMKLSVEAAAAAIGQPVAIGPPAADMVVTTPERLREVDDRDFLLQGIAPPLRKQADGAPVAPAPGSTSGSARGSAAAADR